MVRSHWLYSRWRQASVLSLKFVQELASDFWSRQGAATSHSGAMARSCNAVRGQKVPAELNSQLLIQDTRPCHRGKVKYCAFFTSERAGAFQICLPTNGVTPMVKVSTWLPCHRMM